MIDLREKAKRLAEDLHHEARFERILDIIDQHFLDVWTDGYVDGFKQGRTPLEEVDENLEVFKKEFLESIKESIGDATGEP